jgi:hypothetical protein
MTRKYTVRDILALLCKLLSPVLDCAWDELLAGEFQLELKVPPSEQTAQIYDPEDDEDDSDLEYDMGNPVAHPGIDPMPGDAPEPPRPTPSPDLPPGKPKPPKEFPVPENEREDDYREQADWDERQVRAGPTLYVRINGRYRPVRNPAAMGSQTVYTRVPRGKVWRYLPVEGRSAA